jgi:hypothetical protein
VLYTWDTCAHLITTFNTASKKRRPDHPRPRTGYEGNPSSVFRTPTPCKGTLRETADETRLGKISKARGPPRSLARQRRNLQQALQRWNHLVARPCKGRETSKCDGSQAEENLTSSIPDEVGNQSTRLCVLANRIVGTQWSNTMVPSILGNVGTAPATCQPRCKHNTKRSSA